jgi:hypothetical protein
MATTYPKEVPTRNGVVGNAFCVLRPQAMISMTRVI